MSEVIEKKKAKKRTPAYKYVSREGTVSSIGDAFAELQNLGEEAREIVDNAPEGLNQTERIQTFEQTADTLEGISEPDIPDCISDLFISYSERVPSSKRKNTSRSVRASNAVAIFEAASSAAQEALDEARGKWEAWSAYDNLSAEERDEWDREHDIPEEPEITEDDESDVEQFISECDDIVSEAESCEFPGMFG